MNEEKIMKKKNKIVDYIFTMVKLINDMTAERYDVGFRTNRHVLVLYEDFQPIARGITQVKLVVDLLYDRYVNKYYEEIL